MNFALQTLYQLLTMIPGAAFTMARWTGRIIGKLGVKCYEYFGKETCDQVHEACNKASGFVAEEVLPPLHPQRAFPFIKETFLHTMNIAMRFCMDVFSVFVNTLKYTVSEGLNTLRR